MMDDQAILRALCDRHPVLACAVLILLGMGIGGLTRGIYDIALALLPRR